MDAPRSSYFIKNEGGGFISTLIDAFQENSTVERHELVNGDLYIRIILKTQFGYRLIHHILSVKSETEDVYIFGNYKLKRKWDFHYLTDLFKTAKQEGIFEEIMPDHKDWQGRVIEEESSLDYELFLEATNNHLHPNTELINVERESEPNSLRRNSEESAKNQGEQITYQSIYASTSENRNMSFNASNFQLQSKNERCWGCGESVSKDELHAGYVRCDDGYEIAMLCAKCRFHYTP